MPPEPMTNHRKTEIFLSKRFRRTPGQHQETYKKGARKVYILRSQFNNDSEMTPRKLPFWLAPEMTPIVPARIPFRAQNGAHGAVFGPESDPNFGPSLRPQNWGHKDWLHILIQY